MYTSCQGSSQVVASIPGLTHRAPCPLLGFLEVSASSLAWVAEFHNPLIDYTHQSSGHRDQADAAIVHTLRHSSANGQYHTHLFVEVGGLDQDSHCLERRGGLRRDSVQMDSCYD
jgi:hypothetical protein